MWHLVSLGIVDEYVIPRFVAEVSKQSSNTLIDDLREYTWRCLPEDLYEAPLRSLHGVGIDSFNPLFRYRSVVELCLLAGQPLFGFWRLKAIQIHPVIAAFNAGLFATAKQKNDTQTRR